MDKLPSGIIVGHAQDEDGLTGCTVFIFDRPVIASADIRGSAPATSNFSPLDPVHKYPRIDAVLLTGGSCFGLNAAGGVQEFLEKRKRGFDAGITFIPIVPTAAIFDLAIGDCHRRPDPVMALQACENASSNIPAQGSVGAGTGATVGKFFGLSRAMRGGFGLHRCTTASGAELWAFAVVNAFGDVLDENNGILAGARLSEEAHTFADVARALEAGWRRVGFGAAGRLVPPAQPSAPEGAPKIEPALDSEPPPAANTTLLLVVTTSALDVLDAQRVAQSAMMGLSDRVSPACTIFDGDLAIAASIGTVPEDLTAVCVAARAAAAEAIAQGVKHAAPAAGLPAWAALQNK